MYDGIDVSPLEVVFVKVKEFLLEANWTTAAAASKYSQWIDKQVRGAAGRGQQGAGQQVGQQGAGGWETEGPRGLGDEGVWRPGAGAGREPEA